MKNLLKLKAFLCLILLFSACTPSDADFDTESISDVDYTIDSILNPCDNEDPKTRVINNGTVAFDLLVVQNDATPVVTIFNIPPNSTTSWANFNEGEYVFALNCSDQNVSDDKVQLQMDNCTAFEIEIDSNNQIVSYVPIVL
ncbi:hypothetical protein [Winogradskyella endarachnes]|uniref:Uncharacterized protein n=1 Tax=Winogradskyella endarachnes TaxID=2681965 RepID=A0A6L6U570_9FLAO|nr:hypothetical protein [Winogradskyella endarachnes]MUU77271.1 hypothetical protein [Winogradskyella endarachnes]